VSPTGSEPARRSPAETSVLAFCDYYERPMGGGAEIVSAEIYERLAASDRFDIVVVSGVPGRRTTEPDRTPVEVLRCASVDLSRLIGGQFSMAPTLPFAAWRAVRRRRPDVIHASSIHFVGSLVGAVVAWLSRIPLVTTCHLSGLDALPPRTRRLASLYERLFGRFILRRSARVIAVSETVRDHILTLGVDPDLVEVVVNGVDADRFHPEQDAQDRSDGGLTVAFVGRLVANKAPIELLDAVARLPHPALRVAIVGDGPLAEEVSTRAAADPRIDALGHRSDVETVLNRSDVFVRTSTTEGRSLAILEAMAAGCAVIVSDIPANAELVEHDVTGLLVPPGDVDALAAAIARLADEPDLRQRLGAAARAAAETASWEATAVRTGELLADAAGGRGGTR
jgi:glycogen(starch) synthase